MNRRQFLANGIASSLAAGAASAAVVGLAAGVSLIGAPAQAGRAMFFTVGGLAIDGYDPVSFFSTRGPMRGRRDISVMWKGAIWHFATPGHRDMFELNPWALSPRYGAYCAYAMALGRLIPGSPRAWKLVHGRLYLTQNMAAQERWRADLEGNIASADSNWPGLLLQGS